MWTPQNSEEFKAGPDRLIHCSGLWRVLMWWNAYNSKCVLDEIQSCVTYPRHSYRCNQDNESSWLSMKKLMLSNQNSFLIRETRWKFLIKDDKKNCWRKQWKDGYDWVWVLVSPISPDIMPLIQPITALWHTSTLSLMLFDLIWGHCSTFDNSHHI